MNYFGKGNEVKSERGLNRKRRSMGSMRGWIKKANPLVAVLVALLVIGYLPFTSFLFRDICVNYTFTAEEATGGGKDQPIDLEMLSLNGEQTVVVNGLLLHNRGLEFALGKNGNRSVDANKLDVNAEFQGEPEELWAIIKDSNRIRKVVIPLYLSRLEKEAWNILQWGDFSLYQQGIAFEDFNQFHDYSVENQAPVGLAGVTADDVLVKLAGKGGIGNKKQLLKMPILGEHELGLLVTDNRISIEIQKLDLNQYEGEDTVYLQLSKEGGLNVYKGILADDGNTSSNNQQAQQPIVGSIGIDGIQNGLYHLRVFSRQVEQDYVISSIYSSAVKAGFMGEVCLYGENEPSSTESRTLEIYSNSFPNSLSAKYAQRPTGDVVITLDGNELINLSDKHWLGVAYVDKPGVQKLTVNNPGNLKLSTDNEQGCFSFDSSTILDPMQLLLVPIEEHSQDDYSFIITKDYRHAIYDEEKGTYKVDAGVQGLDIGEEYYFMLKKQGINDLLFLHLEVSFER